LLGIVYRFIATHLIKKAGFTRKAAQTGAITLIQRFGSARNLNVHFHMLFLDGVYVERRDGSLRFRWVNAPSGTELTRLTQTLARLIGRIYGSNPVPVTRTTGPCKTGGGDHIWVSGNSRDSFVQQTYSTSAIGQGVFRCETIYQGFTGRK